MKALNILQCELKTRLEVVRKLHHANMKEFKHLTP